MGLFSKNRDTEPNDEHLTFLTVSQAQELRALVRQAFAENGLEVVVHPDHVSSADGQQFGLWNVAAMCHQDEDGRRAWPEVTRAYVARLLATMDAPNPFDGLTREAVGAQVFARLYEDDLPHLDNFPHREFAPGVVELLALDLPDSVAMFRHEDAQRLGGWHALREQGLRNLVALPVEQYQVLQGPNGGDFHLLLGDSFYTASRALVLPRLIADLGLEPPGEHGWLLGIPNRHQLVWHPIRDEGVIGAIQGMAHFVQLGYGDAPGPLSPHLYWCDGTTHHQLTQFNEAGTIEVHVDERFHAVLEAVAGEGR